MDLVTKMKRMDWYQYIKALERYFSITEWKKKAPF